MSVRDELLQAARVAVVECVGVQQHESCLVVTDPARENIGRALWEALREVASDVLFVAMPERSRDGEEPPAPVADLMRQVDVVFAPTTYSLTHTAARRAACAAGARVVTLPGIRETTMARCFSPDVDMAGIRERTRRMADRLRRARHFHAWTEAGTALDCELLEGVIHASSGLIRTPGSFENLPSGEVEVRPAPGSGEGRVVVDGSMASIGDLTGAEPITLLLEAGRVTAIEGGDTARALQLLLSEIGPEAFHFAEIGFGTNDAARVVGSVLEDEKVFGTFYVALGSDLSVGGDVDVPIHIDGVVLRPSVDLDGTPFMRDGALVD